MKTINVAGNVHRRKTKGQGLTYLRNRASRDTKDVILSWTRPSTSTVAQIEHNTIPKTLAADVSRTVLMSKSVLQSTSTSPK